MIKSHKLISALFNSIQKGIEIYGAQQYVESLEKMVVNNDKNSFIENTISAVCSVCSVSKNELLKNNPKGHLQDARDICVCVLHLKYGLSIRKISKDVFNRNSFTFVTNAIKRYRSVNPKFELDVLFLNKYNKVTYKLDEKDI